jgi:hypothetical protein
MGAARARGSMGCSTSAKRFPRPARRPRTSPRESWPHRFGAACGNNFRSHEFSSC